MQQSSELPTEILIATAAWCRASQDPGRPKVFVLSYYIVWSLVEVWASAPSSRAGLLDAPVAVKSFADGVLLPASCTPSLRQLDAIP